MLCRRHFGLRLAQRGVFEEAFGDRLTGIALLERLRQRKAGEQQWLGGVVDRLGILDRLLHEQVAPAAADPSFDPRVLDGLRALGEQSADTADHGQIVLCLFVLGEVGGQLGDLHGQNHGAPRPVVEPVSTGPSGRLQLQ